MMTRQQIQIQRSETKPWYRSRSGQVAVEYILLMAVATIGAIAVVKTLRENETVSNLVASPWRSIANLIENGVWEPDAEKARAMNPAKGARRLSLLGVDEQ